MCQILQKKEYTHVRSCTWKIEKKGTSRMYTLRKLIT